jgi:Rieske 2Fe-2S family protein
MTTRTPAPIAREALLKTLGPSGAGYSLPQEAYVSQAVFEWERTHFFEGSWTCIGRATELASSGDRKAVRIGSESILLVRSDDGALRGFFNVCRHRGHELMAEGACTNSAVIKCPYHAWVYGLDGRLKGAPHFGSRKGFEASDYPLIEAAVAEWHGWVFVNASGDAGPFDEHVGNLTQFIAPYEPERLQCLAHHDYVIEANWKIIVENYHECYHCPQIHPELCRVTPPDSGLNIDPMGAWAGGTMDLMEHAQTMSLTGASGGVPIPTLDEHQLRQVLYFGLFPNLLISPHPDYLMSHRIEPLSITSSRIECEWLFPPEASERDGFDPSYAVDFWDITNKEDWSACEAVTRGASSRGYRQGPLAPAEDAVHDFMTMVARGYLGSSPSGTRLRMAQ